MLPPIFLALSLLFPAFSTAHFKLISPPARGFDEDKLGTFPCGGQDEVSSNRSTFPLSGGTIQLEMEHDRSAVQVLLGLGKDVGDNFNITLKPIFLEQGIGDFCIGDVVVPTDGAASLDGVNATIQVITNGDPQGGLYNCADVTLSSSGSSGECKNGTGVTAAEYKGSNTNANATNPDTEESSASASPSGSTSASAAAGTASGSSAAAPGAVVGFGSGGLSGAAVAIWVVLVGGVAVGGGLII